MLGGRRKVITFVCISGSDYWSDSKVKSLGLKLLLLSLPTTVLQAAAHPVPSVCRPGGLKDTPARRATRSGSAAAIYILKMINVAFGLVMYISAICVSKHRLRPCIHARESNQCIRPFPGNLQHPRPQPLLMVNWDSMTCVSVPIQTQTPPVFAMFTVSRQQTVSSVWAPVYLFWLVDQDLKWSPNTFFPLVPSVEHTSGFGQTVEMLCILI